MPESIPASLIIDTLKDTFREARKELAAEVERGGHAPEVGAGRARQGRAGPGAHLRDEDEATTIAGGLYIGGEPVLLMIQHAGLYAPVNTLSRTRRSRGRTKGT